MAADLGRVEDLRLPAAQKILGSSSKVLLMSGRDVSRVVFPLKFMLPATNVRLRHGLAGIMRAAEEKESALEVEAAFSEVQKNAADKSKPSEGYSGMTPSTPAASRNTRWQGCQPVSAVVQPVCSRPYRNSWRRKG